MADPCVVGLDVGGSHSRAVLATVDGRTLGTGRAGGGNPTVLGAGAAIANIVAALKAALGDVPGGQVEACVVGLAGVSTLLADPKAPHVLEQAWAEAGLTCPVQMVSDVTVAFAAGTAAPDGTLLVSGTGAVAARMRDHLPVRFRDGYGWLLGDEGSGVWIGRQAARAAIAAADGRGPMDELATAVLAELIAGDQGAGSDGLGAPAHGPDQSRSAVLAGSPDAARAADRAAQDNRAHNSAPAGTAEPAGQTGPGLPSSDNLAQSSAPSRTAEPAAPNHPPHTPDLPPGTTPSRSSSPESRAGAPASAPVRPAAAAPLPLAASIGEGFTLRGRRQAAELVRAVAAQPTVALARLAPLVMAAYEVGDPAAVRIVGEAAEALVDSLAGVAPAPGEPVVLGGSVLVSRSPVFHAVAAAIGRRWPDSPIGLAADGAAGATWLAARRVLGARAATAGHAAFTGVNHQFAEFS